MQDDFENFMDAETRKVRGVWFDGKAAGITHRNPDGSSRQEIARTLEPYDELELRAEPLNPWDPNAIQLLSPAGKVLGYLEARSAAEVCRLRKRGSHARCIVRAIRERGGVAGVSFALLTFPGSTSKA